MSHVNQKNKKQRCNPTLLVKTGDLITGDILLEITLAVDMPWIYNGMIRTCKAYYIYLVERKGIWKNRFTECYLERRVIALNRQMEREGLLLLFNTLNAKYQAKISGSYVLQHLSNTNFGEESDVDMFIYYTNPVDLNVPNVFENQQYKDNVNVISLIHDCCGLINKNGSFIILDIEYPPIRYGIQPNTNINMLVSIINAIHKESGRRVQILIWTSFKEQSLEELIEDSFDLNFCKSTFDGKTIRTRYLFDQIRKVGTYEKIGEKENRKRERIHKYEQRGFKIRDLTKPAINSS